MWLKKRNKMLLVGSRRTQVLNLSNFIGNGRLQINFPSDMYLKTPIYVFFKSVSRIDIKENKKLENHDRNFICDFSICC